MNIYLDIARNEMEQLRREAARRRLGNEARRAARRSRR
jgi:hypothetical protein